MTLAKQILHHPSECSQGLANDVDVLLNVFIHGRVFPRVHSVCFDSPLFPICLMASKATSNYLLQFVSSFEDKSVQTSQYRPFIPNALQSGSPIHT